VNIGDCDLDSRVLIVAEIGNNHEGNFDRAIEMIAGAAEAGANAVKFQTIVPERLVSIAQPERIQQLRRFQFSYEQFERLAEQSRRNKLLFLSTPFDIESARFLNRLVSAFKIASGDNNFFPLLDVVARTGKPIILSTGLLALSEVATAKEFIEGKWSESGIQQQLAVLHCVVSYPTPSEEAHLLAIRSLQTLGLTVGYSDHTLGIEAAVLSVALGARLIEKHFTLDKNQSDFRDHHLSADPAELAALVRRVREAETLLGNGDKRRLPCEEPANQLIRRSIVAVRDLPAGATITWDDLAWVRPGGGLPPGQEALVLNRKLARAVGKGQRIVSNDCF